MVKAVFVSIARAVKKFGKPEEFVKSQAKLKTAWILKESPLAI